MSCITLICKPGWAQETVGCHLLAPGLVQVLKLDQHAFYVTAESE